MFESLRKKQKLCDVNQTISFGHTTFHQGLQLFQIVGPDVQQFFFAKLLTRAQTVDKNVGLGQAWQKIMCLFTDRRGIDAKPRSRLIHALRNT